MSQHSPRVGPTPDRLFLLGWMLAISVVAFAAYVAHDQGYFALMLAADRSYLSSLIIAIFLAASCHAAWHIFATSTQLSAARSLLASGSAALPAESADPLLSSFIAEVGTAPGAGGADGILEIYADRLRSPVEIGWFVVDTLIRLGLLGTIIGFILILASLREGPAPNPDDIRALLIAMSSGMGTALFTTLAGLVAATLLGVQHMILGRSVEQLIAALIRLAQRAAAGQ